MIRPSASLLGGFGAAAAYFGATKGSVDVVICVQIVLSVAAISAGGFAINDYFDVEKDRINEPLRALPSGDLSLGTALAGTVALFCFGLLLAAPLGQSAFALAALNVAVLASYSHLLRINGALANLVGAYLAASVLLFGSLVAANLTPWLLQGGLFVFFYCLVREIVFDTHDVSGDRAAGVRTLTTVWGRSTAMKAAWVAVGASMVAVAGMVVGGGFQPPVQAMIAAALLVSVALLAGSLRLYQTDESKLRYRAFERHGRTGLWVAMLVVVCAARASTV